MTRHILVIDDCATTLEFVRDILEEAGYQVSTAECCVYVNHLIYAPVQPDLILLDLMLPLMSGEKKLRAIKGRERSRQIPVILMSSRPRAELAAAAERSGADGYLLKPFTAGELLQAVGDHLQSS